MRKSILFILAMGVCLSASADNDLRRCFVNSIKVDGVSDGGRVIAYAVPAGSWGIDLKPGQSYCHFNNARMGGGTINVNGGTIPLPPTCKASVSTSETLTFLGYVSPQGYNIRCELTGEFKSAASKK